MTRSRIAASAVAAALSLALACSSSRLTGKDVVALQADPGPECEYVSTVTGASPWGTALDQPPDAREWAERDASEKAATAGATHVRFEPGARPDRAVAKAYRCPTAGTPGARATAGGPAPAGCTKDIECKGERICEAGRCVEPPARSSGPRP